MLMEKRVWDVWKRMVFFKVKEIVPFFKGVLVMLKVSWCPHNPY